MPDRAVSGRAGDTHLGGEDFDARVMRHLLTRDSVEELERIHEKIPQRLLRKIC